MRPKDDWITVDVPELRIVPQGLWDRVQARLASRRFGGTRPRSTGRYILSGVLKCGLCGGSYTIKSQSTYYCTTWRSRGPTVCPNGHTLSRRRAEKAIRDRLCTAENMVTLVAEVRAQLQERARQYNGAGRHRTDDHRRTLEAEIVNLEKAILSGKATEHLLSMLDTRIKAREALAVSTPPDTPETLAARLASVLERLPTIVAQALEDLEMLLGTQQVERGRSKSLRSGGWGSSEIFEPL